MVSNFIYSLLLESDEPQSKHNSSLPAYPVLSVRVRAANLSPIMYVVWQSYSYCGIHHSKF